MTTPDKPRMGLIDGDLMAYKAACSAEKDDGATLEDRLDMDVQMWTPGGMDKMLIAFSCSRKDNYRRDFWPEYKAHRDGKPGPTYLQPAIKYLTDKYEVTKLPRAEADDILGMGMTSGKYVGVTKDKDLRSCSGWFWDPEKTGFPEYISPEEASFNFHSQWLMGDGTDRIPGIYRFGKKKAAEFLNSRDPKTWSQAVLDYYDEVRPDWIKWRTKTDSQEGTRDDHLRLQYNWNKGHSREFALAQARCVRILQHGEWDNETQTPILWSPGMG